MLTLGRTDLDCVSIGSGATNVKKRMQYYDPIAYKNGLDATGQPLSSVFDPIDHVSKVRPDPKRRVFIVGDPRDVQVNWSAQVEFATKLREAGNPNTVLEVQARDTLHHQVAVQAQWVAGWCNKGLSDAEIQAKLSASRNASSPEAKQQ